MPSNTDWVAAVVQLATASGFSTLVWYLLVKHVPTIEQRHKDERMEARTQYLESLKEYHGKIENAFTLYNTHSTALVGELQKLREELSSLRMDVTRNGGSR